MKFIYEQNSFIIILALFIIVFLFNEIGFKLGRSHQKSTDQEVKGQSAAIQAGMLGILGMLLGFSFNMALQRYDSRIKAEIEEANAISTAYSHVNFFPQVQVKKGETLYREYLDLRLELAVLDLTQHSKRQKLNFETEKVIQELSNMAYELAHEDLSPAFLTNYLQRLNSMFDSRTERNAILRNRIPESILVLLFLSFSITAGMIGYNGGLSLKRAYFPPIVMITLIALVIMIIIDLDKPRRGIITVSQREMMELKGTM